MRCKIFALGPCIGLDPQCQNFALAIPARCYLNTRKIRLSPEPKPKICVTLNAKPKRKLVEYRLRWVPNAVSHFGHVHFIFFVLISFALGIQRAMRKGGGGAQQELKVLAILGGSANNFCKKSLGVGMGSGGHQKVLSLRFPPFCSPPHLN